MIKKTKHHLVLDLDSTLIHSMHCMKTLNSLKLYSDSKSRPLREKIYFFDLVDCVDIEGSGKFMKTWGIYRPHVHCFLQFAYQYFEEIHIWSAGKKKYVDAIVNTLFKKDDDFYPDKIFSFNDCEFEDDFPSFKPLSRHFNLNHTFALDDKEETFSKNKQNGILISKYEPEPTFDSIMKDDLSLLKLQKWLLQPEVMNSSDIRKLDKSKIFN